MKIKQKRSKNKKICRNSLIIDFCLSLFFVQKIRNGFSDRKEVAKAINAEKYGVLGTFQVGF
jgi:hypothetical protein